eukprot:9480976-Pyramimonas_sp.AAC.1
MGALDDSLPLSVRLPAPLRPSGGGGGGPALGACASSASSCPRAFFVFARVGGDASLAASASGRAALPRCAVPPLSASPALD